MNDLVFFARDIQAIFPLYPVFAITGGNFVIKRKFTYKVFKEYHPEVPALYYNKMAYSLSAGYRAVHNADAIFAAYPHRKILPKLKAKKFMLFHGTYMQLNETILQTLKHFDHYFLVGPRMNKVFMKLQGKYNFSFSQTGFLPFVNYPIKSEKNTQSILSRIGLDPSQKTILYATTGLPFSSLEICFERILKEIPAEFNLIIRPHPGQVLDMSKNRKFSNKLNSAIANRKNTFLDSMNLMVGEALSVSDLLITDVNCVTEESLFYDIPLIIIEDGRTEENFSQLLKQLAMDQEEIDQFVKIYEAGPRYIQKNIKHWSDVVYDALERADKYKTLRSQIFQYIFGSRDQLAAQRVAEQVKELL
ncbi:hypothetical protein [Candidatus Uabimicrobium amorphum]|uniref:CDP-glycerol--glycerophosphate glycerophosphotransferase n=1 Tax=Uabimicrobium amorphum TaxID=2596890 RepID=A0A5S9IQK9_UABAM|nr:hypothetical protein [Candidatus Uabimicrobium amorphum]BBM85642.1 hypothetical protein UABAM_04016 [Candidatus Uabimicrobium amorphum]